MNVLLAIDAQCFTAKTAMYAIEYTKRMGSMLYVISVLKGKEIDENPKLVKFTMTLMSRIKTEANDEDVESKTMLESGQPIEVILMEADRLNAGTIILGPSQKTTFDKMVIGSVSLEIIKRARCPVIVVK
jgi:nucleotide-binding universal stress UspA family protein